MDHWTHDPKNPHTAESMLRKLAAACNHASSHDGTGFSKNDAAFGHSLAQQSIRGWSTKQAEAALRIIVKYGGQLGGKEFINSWMCHPNFEKLPGARTSIPRRMTLDGDTAVISFGYDAEILLTMKQGFTSHRTLPKNARPVFESDTKRWRVQITDVASRVLTEIADQFGFEMDASLVQRLQDTALITINSRTMLALNDGQHVSLAGDTITIAVDSSEILKEFEMELGLA